MNHIDELSMTSIICLITFFFQYIYSFLKRPADNGFDLTSEQNCLLLNKYD